MTTDMYPQEPGLTAQMPVPQQDPLRALRITANLLPDEVLSGRRARRTRTAVVTGLGVVVLLLGGWYGSAFVQAGGVDEELARAEAEVVTVQQQQRQYSELTDTKSKLNAAKAQLGTLMATDAQWQKLISDIRGAAPAGVELGQVSAGLSTQAGSGEGLPSQTEEKLVGMVTLSGKAENKDQIAAFVDNVRRITGLANPLPTTVASQDGAETFTVQVDITQAALGGRFTPAETPAPAPSTGGK